MHFINLSCLVFATSSRLKPFNSWQKQICPSSPKGNNSMNPSIQRKFLAQQYFYMYIQLTSIHLLYLASNPKDLLNKISTFNFHQFMDVLFMKHKDLNMVGLGWYFVAILVGIWLKEVLINKVFIKNIQEISFDFKNLNKCTISWS